MSDTTHVHQWGRAVYRDGCHVTWIERECKTCGAVGIEPTERNFGLNPIQIAFADPDCARCRELARGHEPDSWKSTAPGGVTSG